MTGLDAPDQNNCKKNVKGREALTNQRFLNQNAPRKGLLCNKRVKCTKLNTNVTTLIINPKQSGKEANKKRTSIKLSNKAI